MGHCARAKEQCKKIRRADRVMAENSFILFRPFISSEALGRLLQRPSGFMSALTLCDLLNEHNKMWKLIFFLNLNKICENINGWGGWQKERAKLLPQVGHKPWIPTQSRVSNIFFKKLACNSSQTFISGGLKLVLKHICSLGLFQFFFQAYVFWDQVLVHFALLHESKSRTRCRRVRWEHAKDWNYAAMQKMERKWILLGPHLWNGLKFGLWKMRVEENESHKINKTSRQPTSTLFARMFF